MSLTGLGILRFPKEQSKRYAEKSLTEDISELAEA